MTQGTNDATVLIVDDVVENLNLLRTVIEPQGYRVLGATNGSDALRIAKTARPDAILLDVVMPGMNGYEVCQGLMADPETRDVLVVFVTMKDDRFALAEAFGVGGVDYIPKPFEPEEVVLRLKTHLSLRRLRNDLSEKNETLEKLVEELRETNHRLKDEMATRERLESSLADADQKLTRLTAQEARRWGIDAFIGQSRATESVLDEIRKLQAVEKTSVLIIGESGTGKELVARAIHFGGANATGPFVAVNCSAITHELAESALFGHVKGAFSGAHANQKGYFEQANGGTLFLDEIGDMPMVLQAKLLRALETGTVQPVGSERSKSVRVRILAATNQALSERVAEKTFRQDLFFRLSGYTLTMPPLRERKEDILLLAQHFLGLFSAEMGRELGDLTEDAKAALSDYPFPGNIRELRNIMEHALIKSDDGMIRKEHLQLMDFGKSDATGSGLITDDSPPVDEWAQNRDRVIARSQRRVKGEATSGEDPSVTDEERVLEYLRNHESIGNTECRDLLSLDKYQASYLLRKLCSYGLLHADGDRRWRRYRLASPEAR